MGGSVEMRARTWVVALKCERGHEYSVEMRTRTGVVALKCERGHEYSVEMLTVIMGSTAALLGRASMTPGTCMSRKGRVKKTRPTANCKEQNWLQRRSVCFAALEIVAKLVAARVKVL